MEAFNIFAGSLMLLFGFVPYPAGSPQKERNKDVFNQEDLNVHLLAGLGLIARGALMFF
jgi:hypothetical protein